MNFSEEYWADLTVRLAYNSTAIDGIGLTPEETAGILRDNYIPRAMTATEFYSVMNYKQLVRFMRTAAAKNNPADLAFIKKCHALLCQNISDAPGRFKQEANLIKGTEIQTVPPLMVPTTLTDWWQQTAKKLKAAKGDAAQKTAVLCARHIAFERIYPFADGNGRVGRALMLYHCLVKEATPIIVPVEAKDAYIDWLQRRDAAEFTAAALAWQETERARMDCECTARESKE